MNGLRLPFFAELEAAQTVLVAGAGGGFDVFTGLPLYFALREAGKAVHLANLSFSYLEGVEGWHPTPAVWRVTADSLHTAGYFPEFHLCRWFRKQGEDVAVFCFDRTGFLPLREAYHAVLDYLKPDTVVLVDGGTDSLMCGDEAGLGTPEEDIASIAVVAELPVPRKMLACIGFGVDAFHGVCHVHCLEAVAELTRQGAFLGAFSLLRDMPGVQRYREAAEFVFRAMPDAPSIVSTSILAAIDGQYGNYHTTSRTSGSELWINPLMAMYWCFQVEAVARRVRYLDDIKATENNWQVIEAIDRYRGRGVRVRPRSVIPDASLSRRTSR
jgi:hypothetical protein